MSARAAQAICILWLLAAIFVLLFGILSGSPRGTREVGYALAAALLLGVLLLAVASLARQAYFYLCLCAGLYSVYALSIPLFSVMGYVLAICGIIAVAASSFCILRPVSETSASATIQRFSRRFTISAAGVLVLCGGCVFASSFYCPAPKRTRLATRQDLVGQWWGIKQNFAKHSPDLSIQRLTLLADGRGSVCYGSQLSYPLDSGTYWLTRGNRVHLSSLFTDAWSEKSFCAELSADGKTMTILDSPVYNVAIYYRSDSTEGKRLASLVMKS
jgi:hypothetical protein